MTEHWLDKAQREHRQLNLLGHQNRPRMSAETIVKLVKLKNDLSGTKQTIYEASLQAEQVVTA